MKANKSETLHIITPLTTILYTTYSFLILLTPIYTTEGIITGKIALTYYYLNYLNTPIHLDSLNTINIFTIPLHLLNSYLILTSITTLYDHFKKKQRITHDIRMLFGGALATLPYTALLLNLLKLLATETTQLNINLNSITSAGYVYLGEAHTRIINTTSILIATPTIIITTSILLAITTLTYYHETKQLSATITRKF